MRLLPVFLLPVGYAVTVAYLLLPFATLLPTF